VSIQAKDSNAVHVQVFNPECLDDRQVMTQNMMIMMMRLMMITFKMATDEFKSKKNIVIFGCHLLTGQHYETYSYMKHTAL
jgi:hypothetical protein